MAHDHAHSHAPDRTAERGALKATLILIVAFMLVEVTAGVLAHSLALLSDAAHMLTDAVALAIALVAARLAKRPASGAMTYGLGRAEILSAQANGVTLLVLSVLIIVDAISRLISPPHVHGGTVLIVAIAGIVVNLIAARILARGSGPQRSLNVEGSYRHILTDLYGFIATAVAAIVIIATGFSRADAIASLMIAGAAAAGRLSPAARVGAGVHGGGAGGTRSRRDRARARSPARRRRGPRPARVGGHLRLPCALGPRGRARRR